MTDRLRVAVVGGVAAMVITAGMTVDQLANADLSYAPPYSLQTRAPRARPESH